jgi:hypothetical protein
MSFNKKIHDADLFISSGNPSDEDKKVISAFLKARKLSVYKKSRVKKSKKTNIRAK